jgi:TIR domain-containing protein
MPNQLNLEQIMPTQEDIIAQQKLLETHRRTLSHYLYQQSALGSIFMPPAIAQGLFEAREHIRNVKLTLRGWGIAVEEHPDDEETVSLPHKPPRGASSLQDTTRISTQSPTLQGTLRVFLCHYEEDKQAVRRLYQTLHNEGMHPWLDEEELLPGQDWRQAITKAVHTSDVIIVCLSQVAITKAGFSQKQIKYALDLADEQPEGTIFIIPAKLEPCDTPNRLSQWQAVDLFDANGADKLLRALRARHQSILTNESTP